MQVIPFVSAFISFLLVLTVTPWTIRYLRKIDLMVKDMNKENMPLVPISGGIIVVGGMFAGLMSYVFYETFLNNISLNLTFLFAASTSILIITLIGFLDDLLIKENHESSSGLKQWQKPLLTLSAAIPLMVVNVGMSRMEVPFYKVVDFGIFYPLIIIPIGVIGAANMVNMLEGYNGLGVGLGLIYISSLGLYAYVNGGEIAALIALMTFSALLAFYFYNKYPAKILPGDSLTYMLGGVLASIAIVGNIEKAAIIISIPFIIEFFLKLRSKFKAHSYGYFKDGKIHSRYNRIYSLPHLFANGKYTEKQIVYFIYVIQLFFAGLIWFI